MIDIIGVIFNDEKHIYFFAPSGLKLNKGLKVIVETERGIQLGEVATNYNKMKKENLHLPLKRVIRIANKEDLKNYNNNLIDNKKAFDDCKKLIKKNKLEMHLIDAGFTLDRKQLLFHFTADKRIDFRQLAKELAAIYKTRIELRQVGIRDKARKIGGIGPCGRLLCCSQYLFNFDGISISMAKNQNIALNPSKINGVCGRLLCCLNYEDEQYEEARKVLPKPGEEVETKFGKGKVTSIDLLNRKYKVEISENEEINIEIDDK